MRSLTFVLALFWISAAGQCQIEVSISVGDIVTKMTGDDLCVEHIDIMPAASGKTINAEADKEIAENELKDLSFQELLRLGNGGDFRAQYFLGCCYDVGYQTRPDRGKALNWYRQAAQQGYAEAQYVMGRAQLGNRAAAAQWYLKAAQAGHTKAQCRIAYHYKFGEGMEQNYHEALGWYQKALQNDSAEAMVNIGNMYYAGTGIERDYLKAFQCFRACLNRVNFFQPYLCYRLGYMYEKGLGIDENYETALKLYRAAADSNDIGSNMIFSSHACHRIAILYEQGLGVEANAQEAAKWARMADAKGYSPSQSTEQPAPSTSIAAFEEANGPEDKAASTDAEAQFQLAESYFLTGDEANLKKAVELFLKAAEQGHAEAQCRLGLVYSFGMGVEENQAEAFKWTLKSAEQGFEGAMSSIADMYYSGHGTERDYPAAMKWAMKAADNGDRTIYPLIGLMYAKGDGVEKSKDIAAEWLMRAAESGTTWGLYGMGLVYMLGRGLEKDPAEGLRWITKAAEAGNAQAAYYVGTAYMQGLGVDKDARKAYEWFNRSIEEGHAVPGTYYRMALLCRDGVVAKKDMAEAYKWLMLASRPTNFPKFTPDYHLLKKADSKSELDDAALEQMSGLSVPELVGVMKEVSDRMTPEQVRAAQTRFKLFIKSNERKSREIIKRINSGEFKPNNL
ncbi:MAG: sel1 repeat family protein [Planctomycetaceae bacterium]|nr:sel1 repeat family protein [Planctomycetaceae bacterium]